MTDTPLLTPAALGAALGVPDEAFRAFAPLRGVAWEARLPAAEATSLVLAWVAAGGSAAGLAGAARLCRGAGQPCLRMGAIRRQCNGRSRRAGGDSGAAGP